MRENIGEFPGGQKIPVGEQDDSLFQKMYEYELKRIEEFNDRIMERLKFLEKEQDPKIRESIEKEIADLRAKKSEARKNANLALNDQRDSDRYINRDVSPLIH